jgi:putative component of membrane protein insertase Oxa1/YidC/SpoIIIJ protein YidD
MLCKYVRCTTNIGNTYAAMKKYDVWQALLAAEYRIAKCKSAYALAKRPQQRGHYSLDKV